MSKILVVYGTKDGQSEKIAKTIRRELETSINHVEIYDAASISPHLRVTDFDAVIVGAPVYANNYPSELRRWVKNNASDLNKVFSAFFSVCLGILEKSNAATQAAEKRIATNFFAWSGWNPTQWTIFPGALMYTKYGWFKKFIMKMIAKKAGGDIDTTKDYEYTDWNEVSQFTHDLSQQIAHKSGSTQLASGH